MNIIRFAKRCYIGTSVLLFVLGIAFLFWPGTSLAVLSRLVGAAMVLFGAARIVGYFSNDPYRLAFQFDFAMGILTCALGLVLLIFPGAVMKYMTALIGLFVVVDAVLTVQNSLEARRFGLGRWWLLLLVLALSVPILIISLKREERFFAIVFGRTPVSRQMNYYGDVLKSPSDQRELRIYGSYGLFRL